MKVKDGNGNFACIVDIGKEILCYESHQGFPLFYFMNTKLIRRDQAFLLKSKIFNRR